MDNYKKGLLTEIIGKMERYKKEYEAKITAWEGVERLTKKDGSDFAILSKNYSGASVTPVSYSIREDLNLSVSGYYNGIYISDDIELYPCVKNYKKPVSEDRIIRRSFLEPYFKMNIEESFEAIQERIELYRGYIEELEKNIADAEKVFIDFTSAIDGALSELKTAAGNNSTLYFEVRHYMERAY